MNKTALIIITLGLIAAFGIIFWSGSFFNNGSEKLIRKVEVKDGVQYITMSAKGGYFPRITEAQAGVPTKLLVKTNGTYDCSASLVLREAGFGQILPPTGETEIDLGTPEKGKSIQGICGMGMYSFELKFI